MKRDDDYIQELFFEIDASDDLYLIADPVLAPQPKT